MPERKYDKMNLDLIQMVQNARMKHDSEALPSEQPEGYWIEAKRATPGPQPTVHSGQWVITTLLDQVDVMWAQIKAATEAGKLGYKSTVSTSSRDVKNPGLRLIYVRTYDANDAADVERVKAALRELGVEGELKYERVSD